MSGNTSVKNAPGVVNTVRTTPLHRLSRLHLFSCVDGDYVYADAFVVVVRAGHFNVVIAVNQYRPLAVCLCLCFSSTLLYIIGGLQLRYS